MIVQQHNSEPPRTSDSKSEGTSGSPGKLGHTLGKLALASAYVDEIRGRASHITSTLDKMRKGLIIKTEQLQDSETPHPSDPRSMVDSSWLCELGHTLRELTMASEHTFKLGDHLEHIAKSIDPMESRNPFINGLFKKLRADISQLADLFHDLAAEVMQFSLRYKDTLASITQPR